MAEQLKPVAFLVTGGSIFADTVVLRERSALEGCANRKDGSRVERLFHESDVLALQARVVELQAEIAALRPNAERYVFLRDAEQPLVNETWPAHGSVWVVRYSHPKGTISELKSAGQGAELDANIDAARAALPASTQGDAA